MGAPPATPREYGLPAATPREYGLPPAYYTLNVDDHPPASDLSAPSFPPPDYN